VILLPFGSIEHEKARFHEQLIRRTIWASPTILDDTKIGMKEEIDYALISKPTQSTNEITNQEHQKEQQPPPKTIENANQQQSQHQSEENPYEILNEPVKMKFFEVPKTGARVTLNSATAILQQYCNRLPHDAYSTPDPVFWRQLDDGKKHKHKHSFFFFISFHSFS